MTDSELIEAMQLLPCNETQRRNEWGLWCVTHESPMGNRSRCVWMRTVLQAARIGADLARDGIASEIASRLDIIKGIPAREFDAAIPGLELAFHLAREWSS